MQKHNLTLSIMKMIFAGENLTMFKKNLLEKN